MASAAAMTLIDYREHSYHDTRIFAGSWSQAVLRNPAVGFVTEEFSQTFQSDEFASFVNAVLTLRSEEDVADHPQPATIIAALKLTAESCRHLQKRWRKPRVVPDGSGGLRLSWKKGNKEVRAIITGNRLRKNYLYRENQFEYGAITNFTAASLYNELNWLYQDSTS